MNEKNEIKKFQKFPDLKRKIIGKEEIMKCKENEITNQRKRGNWIGDDKEWEKLERKMSKGQTQEI